MSETTAPGPRADASAPAQRPRPRRRTTAILLAAAAVATSALLVSQLRGGEAEAPLAAPELTVELHHGATPHSKLRTATPGDRLVIRAKAAAALRLYLDGTTLVASCPGDPRCAQQGAELQLELTLETAGEYRAILLHGKGTPPAAAASLQQETEAARSVGYRLLSASPVQVN